MTVARAIYVCWLIALSVSIPVRSVAAITPGNDDECDNARSIDLDDNSVVISLPKSHLERSYILISDKESPRTVNIAYRNGAVEFTLPPIVNQFSTIHIGSKLPAYIFDRWQPTQIASYPAIEVGNQITFKIANLFLQNSQIAATFEGRSPKSVKLLKTACYPQALHVEAILTYLRSDLPDWMHGNYAYDASEDLSLLQSWDLVTLPTDIMPARKYDPRIGYFAVGARGQSDYTRFLNEPITKWRVMSRRLGGTVREKPSIIFYFDPETPRNWRPWIRKGVESWNAAFRAAGLGDPIQVREPEYEPNMAKLLANPLTSIIQWSERGRLSQRLDQRAERGFGPGTANTLVDNRSGEILAADIILGGPNLAIQDDYFLCCSALDPRAQSLPFPEELMGELLQWLAAHEAGHALGLRDGHYGKNVYSIGQVTSDDWRRTMGFTPSVMNYSRHSYIWPADANYLDGLQFQRIGPADLHAIKWGYLQFGSDGSEECAHCLEQIVRERDKQPWLAYHAFAPMLGPDSVTEVVEIQDHFDGYERGVNQLSDALALLPNATRGVDDANFVMERLYFGILRKWQSLVEQVISDVGGIQTKYKSGSEPGPVYTYVAENNQRSSLQFTLNEIISEPTWLDRPDIYFRFRSSNYVDTITKVPQFALAQLFSPDRLIRVFDANSVKDVTGGIHGLDYFNTISGAIWRNREGGSERSKSFWIRIRQKHLELLSETMASKDLPPEIRSAAFANACNLYQILAWRLGKVRGLEASHMRMTLVKLQSLGCQLSSSDVSKPLRS